VGNGVSCLFYAKKKSIQLSKFKNESEEADWWPSRQGREFVQQNATTPTKKGDAPKGRGWSAN